MGFFKKVFKKAKKITGKIADAGLPKFAKKIARKIRGVGSKIWKGVKNKIIKPILGAVNKLGPLGMIAMSFVMPGIGTMLSGLWSSAAAVLPTGFVTAINKGIAWAAKAATTAKGFVTEGFTTVTDKVVAGLDHISGGAATDIGTAAGNLWDSAKDVVGLGPEKVAGPNLGPEVGQGALDASTRTALEANPELLKATGGDLAKAGKLIQDQQSFLIDKEATQFLADNPEFVKFGNATGEAAIDVAKKQVNFLDNSADAFSGLADKAKTAAKSTLADKLAATAEMFGDAGADDTPPGFIPFASTPTADPFGTNRFGVGGVGSAGGGFLDQSILAQIQAQNKALEALG